MMDVTPELEAMANAILAKVPLGYGMTKPEAIDYARAALLAIRELDDGIHGERALGPAIKLVEDYYDASWSITVADGVWTTIVDHILGQAESGSEQSEHREDL